MPSIGKEEIPLYVYVRSLDQIMKIGVYIALEMNYLLQPQKELLQQMLEIGFLKDQMVGEGVKFERIRRITGYLVGTVDRFNNAKRAELRDRVKHC